MQKNKYFVLGGRFQPFHNGHLEMIKFLIAKFNQPVVIGMADPDPDITYPGDGDWIRFSKKDNPLSYWERFTSITKALAEFPNLSGKVIITPMPRPSINMARANNYLPSKPRVFVLFLRRGDVIAKWKYEQYQKGGEEAVIFNYTELPRHAQLAEGTIIRDLIGLGSDYWKNLVPPQVAEQLSDINLRKRILFENFDHEIARDNIKAFSKENNLDLNLPDDSPFVQDFTQLKQVQIETINWLRKPFKENKTEVVIMLDNKLSQQLEKTCENLFKNGFIKTFPRFQSVSSDLIQVEMTIETKNKLIEHLEIESK